MRFQTFAVIFIAIILPISMVLSYYIQMKSDTISLETKYESKLNNATYAAVSAYQMNSLNTQRVAGESILNYVEASVNTFHTTLATSMLQSNASKNVFRSYIPAILFTTYDGYYIYSPYKAAVPAVVQVNTPITDSDTLAADNGQTILTSDKEVVYMNKGTSTDYRISDSSTIKGLRDAKSEVNTSEFTTEIKDAKMDYSYKLKPFIYYSCRYSKGNTDFVASYSLDNYLTLYGKLDDNNSFSKAGYGIDPNDVNIDGKFLVKTSKRSKIKDSNGNEIMGPSGASDLEYDNSGSIIMDSVDEYYNEIIKENSPQNMKFELVSKEEAKKYIDDYTYHSKKGDKANDEYYYAQLTGDEHDLKASSDSLLTRFQTGDNIIEDTINLQELFKKHKSGSGYDPEQNEPWESKNITLDGSDIDELKVTYKGLEITDPDAKKYYIKAYFFSLWVTEKLGEIQERDAKENAEINDVIEHDNLGIYDSFRNSTTNIFNFNEDNDPSSEISPFFTHKTSVIKNSIQQNLNAAISNFNEDRRVEAGTGFEYTYRMPVLNTSDWDNILNNVCMVSFMQGIPTGYNKFFNSYAIVKSTNNNTFVTPSNLYFTEKIGKEEQSDYDYHKLDCPKLDWKDKDITKELEGDRSAEFKYDALRINSLIEMGTMDDGNVPIVAFEDDTTHTFYEAKQVESEWVIGAKIEKPTEFNYKGGSVDLNDTNKFVTGTLTKYLFDHQNIGCYDCIISGNHDSCVQYYAGNLWPTGKTTDTNEILMNYNGAWYYPDGNRYTGTNLPTKTVLEDYGFPLNGELQKRRQALFNMLGKYKETQYKSNDYINR